MDFDYKKYKMNFYLICSDKYHQRKETSIKRLNAVGISNIKLIESVFVDKIPEDYDKKIIIGKEKKFSFGMLGCTGAWKNAIKTSKNFKGHALIFEDDIFLTENFEKYFDEIYKILCDEKPAMIQLHSNSYLPGFSVNRSPTKFVNTQAVMINRNFKVQLSEWLNNFSGPIDQVFQSMYTYYSFKKYHIDCDIARQVFEGKTVTKCENHLRKLSGHS